MQSNKITFMDSTYLFVSAFFDLERRENIGRRPASYYLEKGRAILSRKINLVIYCDPEFVLPILSLRKEYFPGAVDDPLFLIIPKSLEDLPEYQIRERIQDLRSKGSLRNPNPQKDTLFFQLVQWSKPF